MTALESLFKTDHTVQQNRGGDGEKSPLFDITFEQLAQERS